MLLCYCRCATATALLPLRYCRCAAAAALLPLRYCRCLASHDPLQLELLRPVLLLRCAAGLPALLRCCRAAAVPAALLLCPLLRVQSLIRAALSTGVRVGPLPFDDPRRVLQRPRHV